MAEPPDGPEPATAAPADRPLRAPHLEQLGWAPTWSERITEVLGWRSSWRITAVVVAALVGVAIVGVTVLRQPAVLPELTMPVAGGAGDPAASTTTSTTGAVAVEVVVHAAGAVTVPGVYRMAGGARVGDLLDAAGGPTANADLDRLNLAAPLVDGERIFVPVPDEEVPEVAPPGPGTARNPGGAAVAAPVDLNEATLEELDTLPGVGPTTAQAILDERERRGRFTSVEDLLDVRGIGAAKLEGLRDSVRV